MNKIPNPPEPPEVPQVPQVPQVPDYIEPALRPLAVPIGEVLADPANARQHSPRNLEIIKASLTSFGQQKPIVIDAAGVCLAGNGTLAAARALGWGHIAAVRSSLAGAQGRVYSIADNRATDTSAWDPVALATQLAAVQNDEKVDHTAAGFSEAEIEQFIGDAMGLREEPPPREVEVKDAWQVLVTCNDEADQRHLYERLTQDGYRCRLLTL